MKDSLVDNDGDRSFRHIRVLLSFRPFAPVHPRPLLAFRHSRSSHAPIRFPLCDRLPWRLEHHRPQNRPHGLAMTHGICLWSSLVGLTRGFLSHLRFHFIPLPEQLSVQLAARCNDPQAPEFPSRALRARPRLTIRASFSPSARSHRSSSTFTSLLKTPGCHRKTRDTTFRMCCISRSLAKSAFFCRYVM